MVGLLEVKQVQQVSGAVFGLFLAVHLFNTMWGVTGEENYDRVQTNARGIYQNVAVEVILAVALLLHIVASVYTLLRTPSSPFLRKKLHRWSGVVLLVFIFGHVFFTRVQTALHGIVVGFQGVAFTLTAAPHIFLPYYILFGTSGLFHLLNSGCYTLADLFKQPPHSPQWNRRFFLFFFASWLALLSGILAAAGFFFPLGNVSESDYAQLQFKLGSPIFSNPHSN